MSQHDRSEPPRTRPRSRLIVTLLTALALAVAPSVASAALAPRATAAPSGNATAATRVAPKATSPKATGAHPTRSVCAQAKPGMASCLSLVRTDIASSTAKPGVTPNGYGPASLDAAYGLPSATAGSGATVGIVDAFDYPNAESELATYRAQYGLPACTTANGCFSRVDQRGGTSYPVPDPGWQQEAALDLDMVSAICPNCHIVFVEADNNSIANLGASVNEAVTLGAKYVSNSYGGPEDPSDLTSDSSYFNHPGVAITVSSGDSGYGPAYPAASQYVTAVGGTSLVADSSTRGWSESAWSGAGSGCSAYDPKPAPQKDTGCAKRTIADVSAVADPNTGVAVYVQGGWQVFGGTSVASPIIASVYALAGGPAPNSYPSSYPYADPAALHDVTSGGNGSCSPAYLCTAGPGYDGPTGLGTPNGVAAFHGGPSGTLSGTVTDSGGAALSGASVAAGDLSAATDASGHYALAVPVGTYTVTATRFGYSTGTAAGVAVADGQTVAENFTLTSVPRVAVTGLVRDGSGHGWPVYARVQVAGQPSTAVYTDPATGHYSLSVPEGATYPVQVDPVYTGYLADSTPVTVGTANVGHDVSAHVDPATCGALGYAYQYTGTNQTFDTTSVPAGWTVTDGVGAGQTWTFNDPGGRGNRTGGSGGFAMIDSDKYGAGHSQDSSLVSPVLNLSAVPDPTIQFANDYYGFGGQTGNVDYTTDGGTTWTTVWHHTNNSVRGPGTQTVDVAGAGGKPAVQVRFHFTAAWGFWWELDNVFIGARSCVPTPGGLVVGHVTDHNTGAGVDGAVVTSADATGDRAVTRSPGDPAQGAGFYWLFSTLTGAHGFGVAASNYAPGSRSVNVAPDWATTASFSLNAGRLSVGPASISKTVGWQGTTTQNVKVTNTGSAPVTFTVGTAPGSFTPKVTGAALQSIAGDYTNGPLVGPRSVKWPSGVKAAPTVPADAPWQAVADYPSKVMDNGVASVNGKIYSFTGINGSSMLTKNYVYDPIVQSWTGIADIPTAREKPAVAAAGGKIYVIGGWGSDGNPVATTAVYDPVTDSWSTAAANPKPYAGSGIAVSGGKIYLIGGCGAASCGSTDVEVYDPASDTWTAGPAAPEKESWESCGAIAALVYCAGGSTDSGALSSAYSLNPASATWSPVANLPESLWASGSTVAAGKLLVSGGVGNGALTNAGFSYDPASNTWTALPNSNNTLYRGGSACGLYKIGGSTGQFNAVASDELLPGNDQCASTVDIPWLQVSPSTATVAPGASAMVAVTLDASVPAVTQPGTFTASIEVSAPVPYPVAAVPVSLTVNPPATWGKITGTVLGKGTSATVPIAGATVQIDTWAATYTLKTDKNGHYALWLDVRNNPLTLIAAKDGWQPQTRQVRIQRKGTVTSNFTLLPA